MVAGLGGRSVGENLSCVIVTIFYKLYFSSYTGSRLTTGTKKSKETPMHLTLSLSKGSSEAISTPATSNG